MLLQLVLCNTFLWINTWIFPIFYYVHYVTCLAVSIEIVCWLANPFCPCLSKVWHRNGLVCVCVWELVFTKCPKWPFGVAEQLVDLQNENCRPSLFAHTHTHTVLPLGSFRAREPLQRLCSVITEKFVFSSSHNATTPPPPISVFSASALPSSGCLLL